MHKSVNILARKSQVKKLLDWLISKCISENRVRKVLRNSVNCWLFANALMKRGFLKSQEIFNLLKPSGNFTQHQV
jgi:hypothetical protein